MSLKRCDVFVDKRRKSDLHFLGFFHKYRARWAGVRNFEFPKCEIIISIRLSLFWKEETVLCGLVEPLKEDVHVHVCRSYLKTNANCSFALKPLCEHRTRLRPLDSGWSFSTLLLGKQVKNKTFSYQPPCGCFWRKCRRRCVVFFSRTMSYLMWFAFLPLYRKRTLIYHPSSLKVWHENHIIPRYYR